MKVIIVLFCLFKLITKLSSIFSLDILIMFTKSEIFVHYLSWGCSLKVVTLSITYHEVVCHPRELFVLLFVTPWVWLKKDRSDYLYHQRCTFLFGKLTLKNSTVKRVWWGANLRWVTSYEVSRAARESDDETRRKNLWWFMGSIIDLWSRYW